MIFYQKDKKEYKNLSPLALDRQGELGVCNRKNDFLDAF
jgi:hypothetical protein